MGKALARATRTHVRALMLPPLRGGCGHCICNVWACAIVWYPLVVSAPPADILGIIVTCDMVVLVGPLLSFLWF